MFGLENSLYASDSTQFHWPLFLSRSAEESGSVSVPSAIIGVVRVVVSRGRGVRRGRALLRDWLRHRLRTRGTSLALPPATVSNKSNQRPYLPRTDSRRMDVAFDLRI